jgi:hypothetical protein
MAAKKRRKAPQMVIGSVTKAGKVQYSKAKLAKFLKQVMAKRPNAKILFKAQNAPFMRRTPV